MPFGMYRDTFTLNTEGECVLYNYGHLTSWCILSLFVGAEAAWIPNKVLVWDEIRNPRVDGTSLLSTTVAEFHFESGRWQIEIGIRYGERNKFREPESRERGLWHCDNCRHCILVMSCASSYSSSFLYVFSHFLHFLYLLSTVSISSIYSSTYFPSTLSLTSSISSSHHQFFFLICFFLTLLVSSLIQVLIYLQFHKYGTLQRC